MKAENLNLCRRIGWFLVCRPARDFKPSAQFAFRNIEPVLFESLADRLDHFFSLPGTAIFFVRSATASPCRRPPAGL
jgi:hypothetical protein